MFNHQMIGIHFFYLSFFLTLSLPLSADTPSYEDPVSQSKVSLGKSQDADGDVEFACWKYKSVTVIQINDPAIKGAKEISLRYETKKTDTCAMEFKGKSVKLTDLAGEFYFQGLKDNYLFFDSADSFGNQLDFKVLSANGGRKVLSSIRDDSQAFTMPSGKHNRLSLNYFLSLKTNCNLASEGHACWLKILKKNRIPSSVRLHEPDCKMSFEKGKSPLDNRALVSVPVVIPDLSRPKIVFKDGLAVCEPAP